MIKQIAVFLENQAGKASACCKTLKEAGINLLAISIADTKEFGILRLITDADEKALESLRGAGYLASIVELVGVEVPHRTGALSDLLILLGDGNVNVLDLARVYSHVRGSIPLKDDYTKACAKLTSGDEINISDAARLYAHVKGTKPLW